MTRIVIDDTLRTKLDVLKEPAEFCDAQGRVIGTFFPHLEASLEPQVSEDELRRRERSNKWFTTQEVLDHLRSL